MKQKMRRWSASFLAVLLCVTLLASTAFAAGGALGADRNGTPYTYVIGYMYSGSSQTVNTREIFTSPNNYDIWLARCAVVTRWEIRRERRCPQTYICRAMDTILRQRAAT